MPYQISGTKIQSEQFHHSIPAQKVTVLGYIEYTCSSNSFLSSGVLFSVRTLSPSDSLSSSYFRTSSFSNTSFSISSANTDTEIKISATNITKDKKNSYHFSGKTYFSLLLSYVIHLKNIIQYCLFLSTLQSFRSGYLASTSRSITPKFPPSLHPIPANRIFAVNFSFFTYTTPFLSFWRFLYIGDRDNIAIFYPILIFKN